MVMPAVASQRSRSPHYVGLFPAWEGRRPLGWYFTEQLLAARAESEFPTNTAGHDEDVNIYIASLLQRWAMGDARQGIVPAADPLLLPRSRSHTRSFRADHHRRQADHRLLALGLFDRGDLVRRRRVGWRMTEDETRGRDLTVMLRSYAIAADLMDGRPGLGGLVQVWRKLALDGDRYVHVLQTLARRRLGLGASLGDDDLMRLLAET